MARYFPQYASFKIIDCEEEAVTGAFWGVWDKKKMLIISASLDSSSNFAFPV